MEVKRFISAQTEREVIRQHQAEGIAAAKARGVHFGRRKIQLPSNFEDVCCEYMARQLMVCTAAEKLSMSTTTFYNYYRNNFV